MRAAGGRRSAGALLLAGTLLLTGCGTASDTSPPTGVDELVVPTPSPVPADFVAEVDNPWLALEAGITRRYDGPDGGSSRVGVEAGPVVAGVATTAVTTRSTTAGDRTGHTDWLAQDTRGNVWWFGRAGQWAAGEDDALAGLLMAAAPRVGDGYRPAYEPGVLEPRVQVLAVDGTGAPDGAGGAGGAGGPGRPRGHLLRDPGAPSGAVLREGGRPGGGHDDQRRPGTGHCRPGGGPGPRRRAVASEPGPGPRGSLPPRGRR